MVRNNKEKSFKKNSVINFIGYGIYMGCQWLINIIVVRLSGFSDAGVLSLAISVTSIFFVVAHFNVRTYQVSDYSNQFAAGEYIGQRLLNCGLSLLMCFVYSTFFCKYFGNQLICIITYMCFKLTEAVLDVLHGILQKNFRLDLIGYSFAIRGIVTFSFFALGILIIKNIAISIIFMATGSLVLLFLYDVPQAAKYAVLKPQLNVNSISKIYKSSIWVFLYYFIFNILTILPRSILEHYHGSEMLGIFTSIAAPIFVIQLSATLILTPVVNILTNSYSEKNKEKFYKTMLLSMSAIAVICLIIVGFVCIIGESLLVFLFGEKIIMYAYIFLPLAISTAFLVMSSLASNILIIIRDMKGLILSDLFGLIPCIFFSFILIPQNGIDGIVYEMIISFACMAVFTYIYVFIKLKNFFQEVERE